MEILGRWMPCPLGYQDSQLLELVKKTFLSLSGLDLITQERIAVANSDYLMRKWLKLILWEKTNWKWIGFEIIMSCPLSELWEKKFWSLKNSFSLSKHFSQGVFWPPELNFATYESIWGLPDPVFGLFSKSEFSKKSPKSGNFSAKLMMKCY